MLGRRAAAPQRIRGSCWTAPCFALTLLAGGAIIYSFFLVMATVSFWFLRIENILVIFGDAYQAARWPIGIYPQWLQFILTFVVPVAIAVTVPAEAVVGRLTAERVALSLAVALFSLVALFALAASRFVWSRGLKRYSGASA